MKRKTVAALLTFVTTLTMTACSLQFKPAETTVPDVVSSIHIDIDTESALSNIIDNTDFKNDYALENMTEEITSYAETFASDNEELSEFQKATLVRVVDGDTIVVNIENGDYKVRLIGIDTPESVASQEYLDRTGKENTQAGKDASAHTKDLLSGYDVVYLQKDTSDTDRYGRLLRYVWLEVPDNDYDLEEISTKMLNGILIRDGYANVATYEPDTAHKADFETLSKQ